MMEELYKGCLIYKTLLIARHNILDEYKCYLEFEAIIN